MSGVETPGAATFERRNPVTGSVASTAVAMSISQALAVVDAASAVQGKWAATAPGVKRHLLSQVAEALLARTDELVASMAAEVGDHRSLGAIQRAAGGFNAEGSWRTDDANFR